jgi:hypothetical protein
MKTIIVSSLFAFDSSQLGALLAQLAPTFDQSLFQVNDSTDFSVSINVNAFPTSAQLAALAADPRGALLMITNT